MKLFTKAIKPVSAIILLIILLSVQWQGNLFLATPAAPSLEIALPTSAMLKSSDAMLSCGGIYFSQTAKPANDQQIRSLKLRYNRNRDDGARLNLEVNGLPVETGIPDWQLIPIIKFADSRYLGCLTLTGRLNDENLIEPVLANGGRIINFHPAFTGTLLGWRLLQADLMLLYPEAVNLPEYDEGGTILGKSESEFSRETGNKAFNDLQDFMKNLQRSAGEKHRSWLISDTRVPVLFTIKNGSLQFSSELFVDCWRFKCDAVDMNSEKGDLRVKRIRDLLKHEFETRMGFTDDKTSDENAMRRTAIRNILEELPVTLELHRNFAKENFSEKHYRLLNSAYENGNLPGVINNLTEEELLDIWNISSQINAFYEIVHMDDYSNNISGKKQLMKLINPLAYNSVITTMEYSAFFRYIKMNFPGEWDRFKASASGINPGPAPETPTVIYPRSSTILTRLLK